MRACKDAVRVVIDQIRPEENKCSGACSERDHSGKKRDAIGGRKGRSHWRVPKTQKKN